MPRYTSYPTAPHLRPEFAGVAHARLISAAQKAASVSVYVHIPYCDRLCWFCGCHTSHTLKYEPVEAYVGTLESEIALWAQALGIRPKLSALHFGGGSPSLLKAREFSRTRRGAAARLSILRHRRRFRSNSIRAMLAPKRSPASLKSA